MAEVSNDEQLNIEEHELLERMQAYYPEHASLPQDQRLTNDIRNNIQKIGLRIHIWSRRGVPEDKIDDLTQKGLKRMKELYPTGKENVKTKELLEETINEQNRETQKTGKPTQTQEIFARNMSAFMIDDNE